MLRIINPGQYCRVEGVFEKLLLGAYHVLEWFGIKFNAYVVTYFLLDRKF
jgi:hypothetical protein